MSSLHEDQMAQISANMSNYVRPHSPLDPNSDINQMLEYSAIDKGITDETTNPSEARVASPERHEQENENIEPTSRPGNPQETTESTEQRIPEEPSQEHESMEEEPQEDE